jgi:pimeloyl-ACP methyl ester carboxylesterase
MSRNIRRALPALERARRKVAAFAACVLMCGLAPSLAGAEGPSAPPPARSASTTVAADTSDAMVFSPCQIQDVQGIAVYNAECAELTVPENYGAPGGSQIKLHVARVPAISRGKDPDPLFLLAGGPGMSATALYGNAAPVFGRIRRSRDIILVDQRGTGGSNALNCPSDDLETTSATPAEIGKEAAKCLQILARHAAIGNYTTSVAVKDLDLVRAALGYERINLYGGSYGTRVAQHYLRKYPTRVRTVILDGVVAPEQILGPDTAIDAENALQAVFARCVRDVACKERFGDPAETYRALRKSLDTKPVAVTMPDPTTGTPRMIEFGPQQLAVVLRLAIYNSEQAALLPLALHLAQQAGNFAPLAGQFLMTLRTFDDISSYGMHNDVVCAEDVPFFGKVSIDRGKLEKTFLGTVQVDALESICELWPRGIVDADLHAPLRSDVPVLLLSGGNDPVTPPTNAEKAKAGFANSLHLVLPDLGHGQLGAPCMDRVMADFIRLGTVKDLDTACTKLAKPAPFFMTLSGPTP